MRYVHFFEIFISIYKKKSIEAIVELNSSLEIRLHFNTLWWLLIIVLFQGAHLFVSVSVNLPLALWPACSHFPCLLVSNCEPAFSFCLNHFSILVVVALLVLSRGNHTEVMKRLKSTQRLLKDLSC